MSRLFGPATQNGIVVDDLDLALDWWTRVIGVGPFFRIDNLANEYLFDGDRRLDTPPAMSIALGFWGDLQIELIHPHGEGETTWRRFLRQRGGGLYHISVWCGDDYEEALARASQAGLKLEAHGRIAGAGRYAYFQTQRPDQPLLEIAEILAPSRALFDLMREAARSFDGSDPVRRLSPP